MNPDIPQGPGSPDPPDEQAAERATSADPDPLRAAMEALARARQAARAKGLRPGHRPPRRPGRAGFTSGSGSGSTDRDPHALGSEVDRLLTARGWRGEVQVGSVVGRWPQIVGDRVAAHVTPVAFEGTVLTVQADSTAWATQMTLLLSSVLMRIEGEVGADVVTRIVVKGPGGPTWRKGPLRVQGPGPRDTYG